MCVFVPAAISAISKWWPVVPCKFGALLRHVGHRSSQCRCGQRRSVLWVWLGLHAAMDGTCMWRMLCCRWVCHPSRNLGIDILVIWGCRLWGQAFRYQEVGRTLFQNIVGGASGHVWGKLYPHIFRGWPHTRGGVMGFPPCWEMCCTFATRKGRSESKCSGLPAVFRSLHPYVMASYCRWRRFFRPCLQL
jgi:hypothetical protein